MEKNYTVLNQQSISEYRFEEDIEDAADYLKNPSSFRSFREGLTEMLKRTDYAANSENIYEMSDYLCDKLKESNSAINRETVVSWFSGEHQPKINASSRTRMYEICFALNSGYNETVWFFNHVYYDRAFNCHTINEAVFYYAFRNHLSYREACAIIEEINTHEQGSHEESTMNYTKFVRDQISEFKTTAELKEFLIANRESFNSWNKSAYDTLRYLISTLKGSPENSKKEIDTLKRRISRLFKKNGEIYAKDIEEISQSLNFKNCGLLMQYLLENAKKSDDSAKNLREAINVKNTFSNDFLLEQLVWSSRVFYTDNAEETKEIDKIPYVVRINFPTKKTMSDVLSAEKISVSQSYDAIRKMIILLDFYCFWINEQLNMEHSDCPQKELLNIYIDNANDLLFRCSYEELTAVNPYDWIFLCAAHSDDPIQYFRAYITELLS